VTPPNLRRNLSYFFSFAQNLQQSRKMNKAQKIPFLFNQNVKAWICELQFLIEIKLATLFFESADQKERQMP